MRLVPLLLLGSLRLRRAPLVGRRRRGGAPRVRLPARPLPLLGRRRGVLLLPLVRLRRLMLLGGRLRGLRLTVLRLRRPPTPFSPLALALALLALLALLGSAPGVGRRRAGLLLRLAVLGLRLTVLRLWLTVLRLRRTILRLRRPVLVPWRTLLPALLRLRRTGRHRRPRGAGLLPLPLPLLALLGLLRIWRVSERGLSILLMLTLLVRSRLLRLLLALTVRVVGRLPVGLLRGRRGWNPLRLAAPGTCQIGPAAQAEQIALLEGLVTNRAFQGRHDTSPARTPARSSVDVRCSMSPLRGIPM
ncbi:hypothetical protein GCM10010191_35940 [Actinomadura vinacea]|uniref:Uncharacterized protein n=1 Tax=Actinomadura vinacea TaxID=115336 RepID=A0ABN3J5E7_9ACTN